ncbi:hypothetical protein DSO57_1035102 [Entomophthora muscae]|uniref:Uncharacterized protein n=1 Tax=Entomophthora muscae TaxID=34485 RepID=A0ACC2SCM5_9FUNG|nr:hypothetical protein DSO57_1035102 [Entomophthora muscae]
MLRFIAFLLVALGEPTVYIFNERGPHGPNGKCFSVEAIYSYNLILWDTYKIYARRNGELFFSCSPLVGCVQSMTYAASFDEEEKSLIVATENVTLTAFDMAGGWDARLFGFGPVQYIAKAGCS